jgi:hypothetical protein
MEPTGSLLLCKVRSGIFAMHLEDEVIGIRRRRNDLERALRSVDDPSAIALIRLVIEDMDARIAALEATTQPESEGAIKRA